MVTIAGINVYPEYIALIVLNLLGVLYLLSQKKAKAKDDEDLEPTRRSKR